MQNSLTSPVAWWRNSARDAAEVLGRWHAHEWRSLLGHRAELQERLQLAREARGLRELVQVQIDLVPESWRRFQRDALARRALLSELGDRLRGRAG